MINDVLNDADAKMDKSVEATREEFAAIRAGRANPAMFAKITADYYGTQTPLQQLASFTSQDARTILVSPFDIGAMGAIEKAIRDSDLGVNPANDGKVLRCVFPELTEERRKEFIKVARAKAEDGRVAVRNLRRTAKQHLEKLGHDGEVGQDDVTGAEKRLDAETRLKSGRLKALVATASLELGIDIGHVDLVCQIGSPHRIATLLQRVGRSGHTIAGTPKGRVFPVSCDDLLECAALLRSVRRGDLDAGLDGAFR